MSTESLTAALKSEASNLGFDLVGACPAVSPPGLHRFAEWLAAGYAGEMRFLPDRADAYRHPSRVLDGARSILMLGLAYRTAEPVPAAAGQGRVSRYAWGDDYHDIVHAKLRVLAELHRRLTPRAGVRGVVDTAPLLEREFAQMAGLGWIGKNTLLLNRTRGSWFFLAALLSTEVLCYDEPQAQGHCGTCRACLDACPTGALVEPYVLDARKCISYLTIELRSQIPPDLREGLGDWLFGCDVCQDVCPWNRHSAQRLPSPAYGRGAGGEGMLGCPRIPDTLTPCPSPIEWERGAFSPNPQSNPADLIQPFALDEAAFRARFRATPLCRVKRRGLLRNAAILLGNRPYEPALPALVRGLNDAEPLVRAACAWALGRYRGSEVAAKLRARLAEEPDPTVREEIESAIRTVIGESAARSRLQR